MKGCTSALGHFSDVKDADFELIPVLDAIEHLQDYVGFLCDLKEQGHHKIFRILLDLSVQTAWRKHALLKRRDMYGHLHYFTKQTALETRLRNRARNSGLLLHAASNLHEDLAVRILGGYSLLVLAR
jgi:hypothetical protein